MKQQPKLKVNTALLVSDRERLTRITQNYIGATVERVIIEGMNSVEKTYVLKSEKKDTSGVDNA